MTQFILIVILCIVVAVVLAQVNIRLWSSPSHKPRFGDLGIGQRDDYDSDIKSPEITEMRNKQRADDIAKAWRILGRGE